MAEATSDLDHYIQTMQDSPGPESNKTPEMGKSITLLEDTLKAGLMINAELQSQNSRLKVAKNKLDVDVERQHKKVEVAEAPVKWCGLFKRKPKSKKIIKPETKKSDIKR